MYVFFLKCFGFPNIPGESLQMAVGKAGLSVPTISLSVYPALLPPFPGLLWQQPLLKAFAFGSQLIKTRTR